MITYIYLEFLPSVYSDDVKDDMRLLYQTNCGPDHKTQDKNENMLEEFT